MRRRAEAARRKRIDHVFTKADDNLNGKITPQQLLRIFSANGEVSYVVKRKYQPRKCYNRDIVCRGVLRL